MRNKTFFSRIFVVIGFLMGILMAFASCNLRSHNAIQKRDTTYITRHDTIILRKEVVVRDTIRRFDSLIVNREYYKRDTLSRIEIRYMRNDKGFLELQAKQLAGWDTLHNALTRLQNVRHETQVKYIEVPKPQQGYLLWIILAIAIVFALLITKLLRR